MIDVDKQVTIQGVSGYPSVGGFKLLARSTINGLTITEGVRFDELGLECTIRNNKFMGCGINIGINWLYGNQTIMKNLFYGSPVGIRMHDSLGNTIYSNTFENCEKGVYAIEGAGGHVISDNYFKNCDIGIDLQGDSADIYNNYFSNDVNLRVNQAGGTTLNTTKTAGTNIIDGPYLGGNYWATPAGDGFSETHLDTDGDGIAEEEYEVANGAVDYFPLVTPRVSATITVDSDGSGDYTTIQAALNHTVDGDTIIVNPGTYPEEMIEVNKEVTIKGASDYPSVGGFMAQVKTDIRGLTITQGIDFGDLGAGCTIRNNRFEGCGIDTGMRQGGQTIMNNLFLNSPCGVHTFDNLRNVIIGNTFQNCEVGAYFSSGSGYHTVTENTFKDCDIGVEVADETVVIYNNYFSNDINLKLINDARAQLNTTLTEGENIIGGPYIGGNYWGSPSGDGFSQTHLDTNGDGIAEETCEFEVEIIQIEDVIDYLPLVTPRTEPEPEPTPTPEDPEEEPTEDNSTETNSTETVTPEDNSTADNSTDVVLPGNETNSTDDATETSSSSHKSSGSSSSGGGGGGGSPEPAKNVEVKELSQVFITNGKAVKFEFKNNATCVVSVNFDAIRNAGKTTTIVEQLKNKSALVPELPEGEVYKSFNVWVGNSGYATSKNIENPGLVFKVANSWIQDEQIKKDSITLSRYVDEDEDDDEDGAWTELNTTQTGEDDKFLYFSAETPGYGSFAISGAPTMKAPAEQVLELQAENRTIRSVNTEEEETGGDEERKDTGRTMVGVGIVICALVVVGVMIKSMKK